VLKIKFTIRKEYEEILPKPEPAKNFIPQAFKDLASIIPREDEPFQPTVKKCMPFIDSYNTGYIIPFSHDIDCFYNHEKKQMLFKSYTGLIDNDAVFGVASHDPTQLPEKLRYPKRTVDYVFKFQNPWSIETPTGYSCLFTTPLGHQLPFKLVDGVVDTDIYPLEVNFPFFWTHDVNEVYSIKQGDPMVQIIPFKRESWAMETEGKAAEELKIRNISFMTQLRDQYRRKWWHKKSFK